MNSNNPKAYEMRLPFADGVYTIKPDNMAENLHEIVTRFEAGLPTDGTLSIEAKPRNSDEWFPILSGQVLPLVEAIFFKFTGDVHMYRFTLAGVAGTAKYIVINDLASNGQATGHYDGGDGIAVSVREIKGKVSDGNSTAAKLDAGIVFTGDAVDITDVAIFYVSVYSDQASAIDGLSVQQSTDGTNWDHIDVFNVPAATGKTFSFNPSAKWMRVVYTNGAVDQFEFRLQTILKSVYSKPSSHRIQDSISTDDDAELVKSVLTGQIVDDGFVNIGASDSGNLKTTDAENGLAIAKGEVEGTGFVHKFGKAPDFATSDGEVTVWDGAEDGAAWELMRYVYSTTDDIDSISSSDNGDTQNILIQGLDANWEEVTQIITLTGQTRAALTTPLIRVFRAFNADSTEFAGHVFVYVDGPLTTGIPNTNADIRVVIQPEHQQTLMALYTIPAGKTGYARSGYVSTAGASKASNYPSRVIGRGFGGVFRTIHTASISDTGSSSYQHTFTEPEKFPEKTDIEFLTSMTATGASGAAVSAGFDIVLVDN